MNEQETQPFEIEKLKEILLRKKWLIIICLVISIIPAVLLNELSMPMYRAETVLVFEKHQGPKSLLNPFLADFTQSFITNQIQEIKSLSLAEEVVEALPPGILNTFPLPKPEDREPNFNEKEYIATMVQKGISASTLPNSEVIKIQVEAFSSIAAKVIANTVTEIFEKRNLEIRRAESTNVRRTIEGQLETFKNRLDSAEIALKTFKEQSQVTVIDREAEEIHKRITEAEIIYNNTKANLDAAKERLTYIQNKLAEEREGLVPSITQITSPWAKKLKQQLVDLQGQYTKLKLQNYDEDHPKIIEIMNQIDQTKENLKTESYKIASGENIVDPITQIQKFLEESITLEIEVQTYQAQVRTLQNVIVRYKKNLNTLPNKELRLAQLLREKEVNENIYTMLLNKKEEARIAEAEKTGNIRIIDSAKTPKSPYKPRKKLNLFLAGIFGIVLGVGFAFLTEALDNSIKSVEDLEKVSDLEVLGLIPSINLKFRKSYLKKLKKNNSSESLQIISNLITLVSPNSLESDAFRLLRMNIKLIKSSSPLKTLLFTSPNPREGKSVVITNLAISTAQLGLKTLIIDADIRRPTLHSVFQKQKAAGFVDLIISIKKQMTNFRREQNLVEEKAAGKKAAKKANNFNSEPLLRALNSLDYVYHHKPELVKSQLDKYISQTKIENLDILTTGKNTIFSTEFVSSKILKNIFIELENRYDAIYIDTPPINVTTIARAIGTAVDGTVLIVKSGTSRKKDVARTERVLKETGSNVIGVVVNQLKYESKYKNYYSEISFDGENNNNGH